MTSKSPTAATRRVSVPAFFPGQEELLAGLSVRFASQAAGPGTCLALLDLAALAGCMQVPQGQTPSSLLSPAEQSLFGAMNFPKRQREWLGGRLAGKAAVLHLAPPPAVVAMPQLSILPAANGAPLLSCPHLPAWPLPAVSLSHSDRYAVALAVRDGSCGVDIQKITAQTVQVADRFAQPAEVELLRQSVPDLDAAERMTLLWAAKEALKKGLLRDQPTLFRGVTLLAIEGGQNFTLQLGYPGDGGRPAALSAMFLDEYMLAVFPARTHA